MSLFSISWSNNNRAYTLVGDSYCIDFVYGCLIKDTCNVGIHVFNISSGVEMNPETWLAFDTEKILRESQEKGL